MKMPTSKIVLPFYVIHFFSNRHGSGAADGFPRSDLYGDGADQRRDREPLPVTVPANYNLTAIYNGDGIYIGSTNSLVVGGSNFGTGKDTVTFASGSSTVIMSGIAGNQYSLQRATNVTFTAGISNFPAITAPVGGNVTNLDDFSDLGSVPKAAFYWLPYLRP